MSMLQRVRRIAAALIVAMAVVGVFAPAAAEAHPTGTTLLTIAREGGTVTFDALIPLDQLQTGTGLSFTDHPAQAIADQNQTLRDLFVHNVELSGPGGQRWPIAVQSLAADVYEGADQLRAKFTALSEGGAIPDTFTLSYHVLIDAIDTHNVYVASNTGKNGATDLLGTVSHRHPSLVIMLARSTPIDFASMMRQGINHFRSGTDHIVFLALIAGSTAFARSRKRRRVVDLAYRTTAFTIGHSVSLALAAGGVLSPPSKPIEIGIAVTVLLSAVHLAHPLAPQRSEPLMALVFGLIHGFGFVGTLGALGLRGRELFIATLGFNIGIEIAQLGADLLIAPPLWWLARTRSARYLVAIPAAVVACGWILERTIGVTNPLAPAIAVIAGVPERLALTIVVLATAAALWRRLSPQVRVVQTGLSLPMVDAIQPEPGGQ